MVLQRMQKAFQELVARFRSDMQRHTSTQSRFLGSLERNLIGPILPRPQSLTPLLLPIIDPCLTDLVQAHLSQDDSIFLSRTPLEIRQQIYSLALGGNLLHMLRNSIGKPISLCFARCLQAHDSNSRHIWHRCWDSSTTYHAGSSRKIYCDCCYPFHYDDTSRANARLLGLLLTCRQVYSEAVDSLYTENAFIFLYPYLTTLLSQRVIPHCFSAMRTIHMHYWFSLSDAWDSTIELNGEREWEEAWKVIAEMGSDLRELRVVIGPLVGCKGSCPNSLHPLLAVRHVDDCEVTFRCSHDIGDTAWSNAPSKLVGAQE